MAGAIQPSGPRLLLSGGNMFLLSFICISCLHHFTYLSGLCNNKQQNLLKTKQPVRVATYERQVLSRAQHPRTVYSYISPCQEYRSGTAAEGTHRSMHAGVRRMRRNSPVEVGPNTHCLIDRTCPARHILDRHTSHDLHKPLSCCESMMHTLATCIGHADTR